jgi:hypothetical protein
MMDSKITPGLIAGNKSADDSSRRPELDFTA